MGRWMSKKAFVSIEGSIVKIAVVKNKTSDIKFFESKLEELTDFLKKNSIRKLYFSVYLPDIFSFTLSLSFKAAKKKVLDSIVSNEIKKRYPALQSFSFIYDAFYEQKSTSVYCSVVSDSVFDFAEPLIKEGINIEAFCSIHTPLIAMVNSHLDSRNRLVSLFSDRLRYLFVFKDSKMIFERDFEAETDKFTEEDVANINITINYAIQNLRVQPEEVVLLGIHEQKIEGISIPYRFLSMGQADKFVVPLSMALHEKQIIKESFLPGNYKSFRKKIKYLNYAKIAMAFSAVALLFYNALIVFDVKRSYEDFVLHRDYIKRNEQSFFVFQNYLNKFEKQIKPYVALLEKRNSITDTRFCIHALAEATVKDVVNLSSVEIQNGQKTQIKIKGQTGGESFSQRLLNYSSFKSALSRQGFVIVNENWDLMKGEFSITAEYEVK